MNEKEMCPIKYMHDFKDMPCKLCHPELKKVCVGCDSKVLTRCDGTMCEKCWSKENDDRGDMANLINDNINDR